MHGEFAINGFRNLDLRAVLFGTPSDDDQKRRHAANITRLLLMLQVHRMMKMVSTTHRYFLTIHGQTTITAFLVTLNSDTKQLNKLGCLKQLLKRRNDRLKKGFTF
jgi:hypothetical protein